MMYAMIWEGSTQERKGHCTQEREPLRPLTRRAVQNPRRACNCSMVPTHTGLNFTLVHDDSFSRASNEYYYTNRHTQSPCLDIALFRCETRFRNRNMNLIRRSFTQSHIISCFYRRNKNIEYCAHSLRVVLYNYYANLM